MIAMALVLDPVLLIADEPTTALGHHQAQILHLIKALQARHDTGVLFITHDFGVVAEIADRVAVYRGGSPRRRGGAGADRPARPTPERDRRGKQHDAAPPRPGRVARWCCARKLDKTYGGGGPLRVWCMRPRR